MTGHYGGIAENNQFMILLVGEETGLIQSIFQDGIETVRIRCYVVFHISTPFSPAVIFPPVFF